MASSLLAIAVGFVALHGLVVLLREAGMTFQGNEIAYAMGAGAWLLGAALGGVRRERRGPRLGEGAALLTLGWGIVVMVVAARGLPLALRAGDGTALDLPRLVAGVVVLLGPPGFLAGTALRRLVAARLGQETPVARTWAVTFAGAAIGGATATLWPAVGGGGLVAASAGTLVAWAGAATMVPRGIAAGALAATLAGVVTASGLDVRLIRWTHPGLVGVAETAHGRVTIESRRDGGLAVFVDDALAYERQGTAAEEFAAFAAVQRPTPGDVLVLGGWTEGLAEALVPYGPRRVDSVEADRGLLQLTAPRVPGRLPGREVMAVDPRRFLAGSRKYDLIVSALPEPSTGRANRHDTVEFFVTCAAAMSDSGVLAIRLRTPANVWTARQARRAAAVHAALASVFVDVVVLPGTETVFLASKAPLTRDADVLVARLERAAPDTRVVCGGWLRWRYTNEPTVNLVRLLEQATVPANRDLRPACYADAVVLDLARLFPGLGWHSPPAAGRWLWFALAILLAPAVLARRQAGGRRNALASYAGLAGAGATIVLLLHDQTARAVLYRDMGVFLGVGAGGIAAGVLAGQRDARRRDQRWRRPGLAATFSFLNCAVAFSLLGGASGWIVTVVGLAAVGNLTGMLLAAAVADAPDDARAVLGAASVGGCVGCALTALLLIPFAGLSAACLALAVLAFPAAIAVWPPTSSVQG